MNDSEALQARKNDSDESVHVSAPDRAPVASPAKRGGAPKGRAKPVNSGRKTYIVPKNARERREKLAAESRYDEKMARISKGLPIRLAGPTGKAVWWYPDKEDVKWALDRIGRKTLPDLASTELTGDPERPLAVIPTESLSPLEKARRIAFVAEVWRRDEAAAGASDEEGGAGSRSAGDLRGETRPHSENFPTNGHRQNSEIENPAPVVSAPADPDAIPPTPDDIADYVTIARVDVNGRQSWCAIRPTGERLNHFATFDAGVNWARRKIVERGSL